MVNEVSDKELTEGNLFLMLFDYCVQAYVTCLVIIFVLIDFDVNQSYEAFPDEIFEDLD